MAKVTVDEYLERFKFVYGDTFDYSLVREDYVNSNKQVRVICKIHGKFLVTPKIHGRTDFGKKDNPQLACPKCKIEHTKSLPQTTSGGRPEGSHSASLILYRFKDKDKSIAFVTKKMRGALLELEKKGYKRKQIVVWDDWDRQICIKYYDEVKNAVIQDKETMKTYSPDIMIPEENLIIHLIDPKDSLEDNEMLNIRQSCLKKGYHFQIWRMTADGRLKQIYL